MRIIYLGFLALSVAAMITLPSHAQKIAPEVKSLVEGNTDFGVTLYQRLAKEDGNLFFSPYSISNAFGMCYAGAKGNTAAEMKTTLRFNLGDDRLHPAFRDLIASLDGGGKKRDFQLTIANRLWGQKDYGFAPEFIKTGQAFYGAGLEEVDYIRATEAARKTINTWVEKQTKDKIKELIPQGVLDENSRLVLTNAIYFKAPWLFPFDAKQTKPAKFNVTPDKSIDVPTMHAHHSLRYANLDTLAVLEMFYGHGETSMLMFLPQKKTTLADLEKQLTAPNLAAWTKKISTHLVDLKMPKFKVTKDFALNKVLKDMGMKAAFEPGKADFSGMATREKLYITAVLHKAFVDVHELGTEAAAATAIGVGTTSVPPPATFHVDRPFVFVIRDNPTGTILFMGRVVNPS
jgi:serpin B